MKALKSNSKQHLVPGNYKRVTQGSTTILIVKPYGRPNIWGTK